MENVTEYVSLLLQAILIFVVSPINKRIEKIEKDESTLQGKETCNILMCKHDGELKRLNSAILKHEERISKIEGRTE